MTHRDFDGRRSGGAFGWIAALVVVSILIGAGLLMRHEGVEVSVHDFGLPEPFETIVDLVVGFFVAVAAIVAGLLAAVVGLAAGLIGLAIGLVAAVFAIVLGLLPLVLPIALLVGIGILIGRGMNRK